MAAKTATCACCGNVSIRITNKGKAMCLVASRSKNLEWQKTPAGKASCLRRDSRRRMSGYRSSVGMVCKKCGFTAAHQCQIDVHHKDGDHDNNENANLEALCSNCHRLETAMQRMIPAHLRAIEHATRPEAIEYHKNMAIAGTPVSIASRNIENRPLDKAKEMMASDVRGVLVDDGKLRKQLDAMTKDYQFYYDRCEELELKVVAANQEAEAIAAWTEDEKMKYWRDRAMRCEAALKSKGGEFNQEG